MMELIFVLFRETRAVFRFPCVRFRGVAQGASFHDVHYTR